MDARSSAPNPPDEAWITPVRGPAETPWPGPSIGRGQDHRLPRRAMLQRLGGWTALPAAYAIPACSTLLAWHDALAEPKPRRQDPKADGDAGPVARPNATRKQLIAEVELLTAVPLAVMRTFYHERIGLPILEHSDRRLVLAAGASRLAFSTAPGEVSSPFYHFAFNIPPNTLMAARRWQLRRSPLVPTPPRLRDPAFPDDVRHFRSWNAHSLFFFDPALNVVEYIARHDLDEPAADPDRFDVEHILYISEIGFVVEDQAMAARAIHRHLGLEAYPRGTTRWWAMGDERGLLLCLPKGRIFGELTATPKAFDVFPTTATVRRPARPDLRLAELPYHIRAKPS